jgi:NAD(P)-dependent dehydrogenase (short-subunit alcohol dehydrogenase family)
MPGLLEGKVAIVTGAGHGIGRAHALELAHHGAQVVVNDLGGSVAGEGAGRDAEKVVALIHDRGGTAVADFADVGDETQVEGLVAAAFERFGKVDILVNNAGIIRDRAIWNMSVDDFDRVMRVHVRGSWLTSHFCAQRWRAAAKGSDGTVYGRIINTTSGAGLWGNFGQTNYATAKSAIVGLTLSLSLELAGMGVTVNAISPVALTRLSATLPGSPPPIEADERPADVFDPEDPAVCCPLVAWLASPQAGWVSGQIIRIAGTEIIVMNGWGKGAAVDNDGVHWDARTLGRRMETELFRTRAAGLRLGA